MIREQTISTPSSSWLQVVQRRRKLALLGLTIAAIGVLLVSESTWASGSFMHDAIGSLGSTLIIICLLGRTWCTLYIGGRKKVELVQDGPYSISRNPLYIFWILGAGGVGAAAEGVVTILLAALACYAVFAVVVSKEEEFLADRFKEEYAAYRARVPRFWPRFSEWRDAKSVETSPRLVLKAFGDGLFLLLSIPLLETIEYLHEIDYLPVFFVFP